MSSGAWIGFTCAAIVVAVAVAGAVIGSWIERTENKQ